MRHPLTALLLLAAFGLGVLLGPHPCGAGRTQEESAKASCHESEPRPAGQQVGAGAREQEEEEGTGCGTLCQHACHMTAITEAEPAAFAISPGSEAIFELSVSRLSRFVHPIDHIPLV